eukprot:TRINITY_DN11584_c0_g10_i1.p1 TRINITY_DN11584_c0_g10~~TRINITY_DN11584_c0_g10_i1.p1  ORF type:complete len:729 (+),score=183.56 TRINITY_DN11584_c0_g10_i1:85-2271(+)
MAAVDAILDVEYEPDPKATDYESKFANTSTAIIIDHGSSEVRAGWSSESKPRVRFPCLAGKSRGKKDLPTYGGNDALAYLSGRNLCRTSMEGGIVVAWDVEEHIVDHVFRCLGVTGEQVNHRIVMTEAVCNPNICRARMSELLFELYGAPEVCYGIDSLFSWYHNHPQTATQGSGLVLSGGHHGSYILPVIDGQLQAFNAKRIDIGGEHLHQYAKQLFNIRQPFLKTELNEDRVKTIVHDHCYVTMDYQEKLKQLESNAYFDTFAKRLQLPLDLKTVPTEEQLADRAKRRLEQAARMKEMHTKRQQALLKTNQEKHQSLMQSMIPLLGLSSEDLRVQLSSLGFASLQALAHSLDELHFKVHKAELRLSGFQGDVIAAVPKLTLDEPVHNPSIIDGPVDPEWPEGVLRLRRQVLNTREIQGLLDVCRADTLKAEQANTRKLSSEDAERRNDPEKWATGLRNERNALQQELEQNRKIRQELSDRRSGAAKARMRLMAQQMQPSKPNAKKAKLKAKGGKQPYRNRETEDDDFGMDDNDWAVYNQINLKEDQGDDTELEERLAIIDTQLEEYEAQKAKENPETREQIIARMQAEMQFELGVEQIQVPELVFQPAMMGVDQTGLAGAMEFVFPRFTTEQQQAMAEHIFVTGGLANIRNMTARIEQEVIGIRPFQSVVKVYQAKDPVLDAWHGARGWALDERSGSSFFTKLQYDEMGSDYLAEHFASNREVHPC